jgi:hypothetical protein
MLAADERSGTYADAADEKHTPAYAAEWDVCWCMLTHADVC